MIPTGRNVEAKYRCRDLPAARRRAEELGARDAGILRQTDHYFEASRGRLKLREFGDGTAELIGYVRADVAAPRMSDYLAHATSQADVLATILGRALGSRGVVRKVRTLLLWRNTRIHLDEVEGVGTYVELETAIGSQSDAEAERELREAADALGLFHEDVVPQSYIDLLDR